MNLTGLSLDNIPPVETPLKFFLVAPVFGVLAGILLIGYPELLTNRWLPATLAFTHLLTLGVGTMVMLGALFQVLPVVSNRAVPWDQAIAPWVRWGMVWGTLALTTGFLTSRGWLIGLAALLLASGFVLFVSAFGTGLVRARPAGATTVTLRLAALSLVATLVLGGMQLSLRLWPEAGLYEPHQTFLHAFVGGFGWVLLLIMGVSFQVIPMFHVAPAFPRWLCRQLTLVIFTANAAVLLAWQPVAALALPLTLMAAILYASVALKVLMARKRKLVDYTVRFWQLGLSQLITASLLALGLIFTEGDTWRAPVELLLGLVFTLGFVLSVMLGMLQKIAPLSDLPASAAKGPGQPTGGDGETPPYESTYTDRTLALAVSTAIDITALHLPRPLGSLDGCRRRSAVGGCVWMAGVLPVGGMAPVPMGGIRNAGADLRVGKALALYTITSATRRNGSGAAIV